MLTPSAIIFVNADILPITQKKLIMQLGIYEAMTDTEFNARIVADPNYAVFVHLNNLRILVLQQSLQNFINSNLADIVLFVKQGLATVIDSNCGLPTLSMTVERINTFNLLANINMSKTFSCAKCNCGCLCNCFKDLPNALQLMLINPFDASGVHNANCDNQYNNPDWINRK